MISEFWFLISGFWFGPSWPGIWRPGIRTVGVRHRRSSSSAIKNTQSPRGRFSRKNIPYRVVLLIWTLRDDASVLSIRAVLSCSPVQNINPVRFPDKLYRVVLLIWTLRDGASVLFIRAVLEDDRAVPCKKKSRSRPNRSRPDCNIPILFKLIPCKYFLCRLKAVSCTPAAYRYTHFSCAIVSERCFYLVLNNYVALS